MVTDSVILWEFMLVRYARASVLCAISFNEHTEQVQQRGSGNMSFFPCQYFSVFASIMLFSVRDCGLLSTLLSIFYYNRVFLEII